MTEARQSLDSIMPDDVQIVENSPFRKMRNCSVSTDRAAMDTHAQLNTWIALQRLADFHRTFHRRFGVVEKYQRHPITSRQPNQLTFRLRFLKMGSSTDNLIQLREYFGLVIDQ